MNLLYNFNATMPSRPSFFELYIQSQMMPSIKPAIQYILSLTSRRFPRLFWVFRYCDEIFYIGLASIEYHYLQHYDGLFSENFNGLKRVKLIEHSDDMNASKSRLLTPREKTFTIFSLIIFSYIKDKLDDWYNRRFSNNPSLIQAGQFELMDASTRENNELMDTNVSRFQSNRFRRCFLTIIRYLYPLLYACYQAITFSYQLLYMYQKTLYFSPWFHLQNVVLKNLSMDDMVLQTHRAKIWSQNATNSGVWTSLKHTWSITLDYFKYLLPISIFFFKFLEWWHSEHRISLKPSQPILPPPDIPKLSPNSIPVPSDKLKCPICGNERKSSAMISSGFVFCYSCIHSYIQEYGQCPITNIPTNVQQIRKIFDE